MAKHISTIEINGKLYDARTGRLLSHIPEPVSHTSQTHTGHARSMQDIAPRKAHSKTPHHTPERSKTLMRHAVKKPAKTATHAKAAHAVSAVTPTVTQFADFRRPLSLSHENSEKREIRASKIKRSNLVQKFSDMSMPSSKTPLSVQHLPVKQAPEHPQPTHAQPKTKTQSILEKGLKNATSHQELPKSLPKKHRSKGARRVRLASVGAASVAVLLLVGFFGYQNVPNIAMRYATTRAGVDASLPAYKPAGFALNSHIQYNPGQVVVKFNSNTDERAFTITQRESAWNSDTLRQNYVAQAGEQVHTFEDKGQTIYLYGDSNATWVNGGVWYDIQGNSLLNSDQLIRIATSM